MAAPTYEATPEEIEKWKEESRQVDPEKCFLRMERQTLHRLERTGALVFGFKTFMEPIPELKREGSGRPWQPPWKVCALEVFPRWMCTRMLLFGESRL